MEIFIGNNEALVLVSHLRSGTLLVVSYTTLHVGGGWLGQVRPVGRQNHPLSQIAKNPALVPDERTHQYRGVVWRFSKPFFFFFFFKGWLRQICLSAVKIMIAGRRPYVGRQNHRSLADVKQTHHSCHPNERTNSGVNLRGLEMSIQIFLRDHPSSSHMGQ